MFLHSVSCPFNKLSATEGPGSDDHDIWQIFWELLKAFCCANQSSFTSGLLGGIADFFEDASVQNKLLLRYEEAPVAVRHHQIFLFRVMHI